MYTTIIVMLAAIAAMVSAQDLTLVNIIQFSDDYCLCPNEQHISVVDLCVPVIGGYSVYRLVDGTPDQVIIQTCSDNQCTQCTNTTTYNARPPCQTETDGIAYYSVLPENDPTTYYNAPSVVTVRFPYKNCSGDALHIDIAYGLSCFPTQEGGSFYYQCPDGVTSEYYIYNCSDNACLEECTPSTFPTEQCIDDEGVFKSVYCTPSSSTTQTATSNDNTATSNDNTATSSDNTATGQTMGSATVSTTTSASSHNVSSSASAANNGGTSASSATSGGSSVIFSNDNRGGQMHRKAPRSNPPFCNGGVPSSSSAAASTASTGANTANGGTASTSGGSGGSSGSSGGRGAKIFMTKN